MLYQLVPDGSAVLFVQTQSVIKGGAVLILGHAIALDPTPAQAAAFRRACGVARFSWNWGLAEWQRMHAAGEKPSAKKLKSAWNAHRKTLPWTFEVTKCASGQAILDLGTAFTNFFRDLKKPKGGRKARFPRFKSKHHDNGFALWNDQFEIEGSRIRIPKVGWVKMCEPLRFAGKIMGARITRIGTRWHASVQVETQPVASCHGLTETIGIDLGISALMTFSKPLPDGRMEIVNPRARKSLMRRQTKLARRISRQELQRRKTNAKTSRRQMIRRDRLRKLHYRMASIRKDALHKATTAITDAFGVIVIEDLNVAGMAKNKRLAGSILDASFREARRMLEYKAAMRGGRVIVVDRFFPSSKTCSSCDHVIDSLPLSKREWTCPECGTIHHRDLNAAINLERVGTASPEPLAGDPPATRGDIGALAAGQPATKLRWSNRDSVAN